MPHLSLLDNFETNVYPRLEEIGHWREMGYREQDIAAMCGISINTFKNMKSRFPELREQMEKSKARLIMSLEKTLFQKALDGDRTCLIFSLKNLAPDRWKDVHQVENSSEIRIVDDLSLPAADEQFVQKAVKKAKEAPLVIEDNMDIGDVVKLRKRQ